MRVQISVTCANCLIALVAFFAMTNPFIQAEKTGSSEVAKLTGTQIATHRFAHRGSGRIVFRLGQSV
jgi:hypothetical protein